MSLNLDDRQRAMLAEMGVRVWWPSEPVPVVGLDAVKTPTTTSQVTTKKEAVSLYPAMAEGQNVINSPDRARGARLPALPPKNAPVTSQARPMALLALPEGVADMDWQGLSAAVASCQACAMCLGRQAPVFVPPPGELRCDWLVLGDPPDDVQERAGQPFVDDAGHLLDNMLKAVGAKRCTDRGDALAVSANAAPPLPHSAYLSHVLKCRPARPTTPDAAALALCATYLRREIALLQPRVILAMGRFAMQVLLSEEHPTGLKLPLGKLRGQVWHYQGVPVVVTYPPAYLLRTGQDKARAWADLCLAQDVVQGQFPSV